MKKNVPKKDPIVQKILDTVEPHSYRHRQFEDHSSISFYHTEQSKIDSVVQSLKNERYTVIQVKYALRKPPIYGDLRAMDGTTRNRITLIRGNTIKGPAAYKRIVVSPPRPPKPVPPMPDPDGEPDSKPDSKKGKNRKNKGKKRK